MDSAPDTPLATDIDQKVAEATRMEELQEKIVAALKTCFDPEIPINIYELGLIYEVAVSPEGNVRIKMTLTSPACPAAGSLPPEVQRKVKEVPGVADAQVEVVWDPIWSPARMTEAARLQLGIDYY
jgi:FeS assembly SUF system protein